MWCCDIDICDSKYSVWFNKYDGLELRKLYNTSYIHHLYSTCGLQVPALRPKAHPPILSHRQWSVDPCLMRVTSHAGNRDLKNYRKPLKAQPGACRERQLTHNTNSPMSWNHNGLGIEYQQHSPMLQYPFLSTDYWIVQKRFQKEDLPPSNDKNTAKTQHSLFLALPANLSGQHFSSQQPRPPKLEGIVQTDQQRVQQTNRKICWTCHKPN